MAGEWSGDFATLRAELLTQYQSMSGLLTRMDDRVTCRLDVLAEKVATTNDRAVRVEAEVHVVANELTSARKRWHERFNELTVVWQDRFSEMTHALEDLRDQTGEASLVRRGDLRLIIMLILGTVGVTLTVLSFMGKLTL